MKRIGILMLVFCACFVLSAWAQAPKIITFDVPGAGTAAGQGTLPQGINATGEIIGWWIDANNVTHGLVRYPDGTLKTVDLPGSGTAAGQGTDIFGVNAEGEIAGVIHEANNVSESFIGFPDGRFWEFDDPAADPALGSYAANINDIGTVFGGYADSSSVFHAYLLTSFGKFINFGAPDAGTAPGQGTLVPFPEAINLEGSAIGWYVDSGNVSHGFLRSAEGSITEFNAPGAGTAAGQGTTPISINLGGTIIGFYVDANWGYHGFLRTPDGVITNLDYPGAAGTIASLNNDEGAVTGYYWDASGLNHGFLLSPDGKFASFDAPGAGTGAGQGTLPDGINDMGEITGYYLDSNNVQHGFLRMVQHGFLRMP